MSRLNTAVSEINKIEMQAKKTAWLNQMHPLGKLFITIFYMAMVVSFEKYDLVGLLGMLLYPLFVFIVADISFRNCIHRVKMILPIVVIVGIWNPFFDRTIILTVNGIAISGGMVSMFTLIIKGIFTILAAYLLIITTSIERICYAMRKIHIPRTFVTVVLLIYRYIIVLLIEAEKITQAYSLRAPKHKGIQMNVWGSLVGQLLIRSMDRAIEIYESMNLRGYGNIDAKYMSEKSMGMQMKDIAWVVIWTFLILALGKFPVFVLVGNIFV